MPQNMKVIPDYFNKNNLNYEDNCMSHPLYDA